MASPDNAALQSTLAIAETFANEGDPLRASSQVDRALQLSPDRADLALISGLINEATGHPDHAFDHYQRALLAAIGKTDPTSIRVAEVAVVGISGLYDTVPNYNDRTRALLEPLATSTSALNVAARNAAISLLLSLAERRGDVAGATLLTGLHGCVTQVRVAGPFGPHDLIGFDRTFPPQPNAPLADSYDLGPRRGERATRNVVADGCAINLGGGPVAEGGVTYAQGRFTPAQAGRVVLRLSTPNSAEVFIDGTTVARVDRRVVVTANTIYLPVTLSAGEHLITIKLASRHPNPAFSIGFTALRDMDLLAVDGRVKIAPRNDFDAGFQDYLRATVAFERDDLIGAREALRHVDGHHAESPLLLMQAAHAWLRDPLTPADVRMDRGRALLEASLQRMPDLWGPTLRLAGIEAENGRVNEAIATLRKATQQWPKVPSIALSLIELLSTREWNAEADRVLSDVRARFPQLCGATAPAMNAARRRMRADDAAEIGEEIMRCNARSNARFTTLVRERKVEEARAELQRLISLDATAASSLGIRRTQIDLALQLGEVDSAEAELKRLQDEYPSASSFVLERIDRVLQSGDRDAALAILDAATERDHAAMASLRRVEGVLRGQHIMDPHRVDGLRTIADYESSGRSYDGPEVLVWDYMVVRVFPDGSALKLVHSIHRVQSDEAADELGEVEIPEDARVLTLRTVKSDMRVLEPDAIDGKETISLPDVAPGDYTEFEYLIADAPSAAFPRGYMGDRFYFRSFEVPFDISQLVTVLPKDMPVTVDRRGDAPPLVETALGDQRVMSWKVIEGRPLTRETSSVAHREYVPSVRVVARAPWNELVESIRDALLDRDLQDPEIVQVVSTIVGEAAPTDHLLRAQRLYYWVLENIEDDAQIFGQAALMVRARSGNRARALHYMLGLAGVSAQLALARSKGADATVTDTADPDTYAFLVIRIEGSSPTWLSTVDRWAPFGYLPPALRGQDAIMLTDAADIVRLRDTTEGEDRRTTMMDVQLADDGSAVIDVVERFAGAEATGWREGLEGTAPAELERRFEESYVATLVPGARMRSLNISGRDAAAATLVLQYSFEVAQLGRRTREGWAVPAITPSRLAARFATVATRTTTELLTPPMDTDVTVRLHVPPQARAPRFHASHELHGPGQTQFIMQTAWQPGLLTIHRTVHVPMARITPSTYAQLSDFCHQADVAEGSEILFHLR
jgi:tetratricopeptide (TPR) repeat protein